MVEISGNFLFASFIFYLVAILFFGGAIRQKKGMEGSPYNDKPVRSGKIALLLTILGFICQLCYFITRWIASNHAPVSNMFEFITFFSIMMVAAFIIIYFIYGSVVLGLFTLPIVLIIIAYGSMFTKDVTPLIPALQSYWLPIHVMTTAAGQAILSISFIAGLVYLIKKIDQSSTRLKQFFLEMILYFIVVVIGFIVITSIFLGLNYQAEIEWVDKEGKTDTFTYTLPPLVGPNKWHLLTSDRLEPIFELPEFINAQKLNTVFWSFIIGSLLYLIIRLIFRKKIAQILRPFVQKINSDFLDEISYRSVLIGFPVFTLGGLVFAMIWAQIAWTRFWAWDPKEVWALITWLFYAAFLHLRLSKGWHGEKSAWLAVLGFGIIMFNLVFVNLIIAGLHSYV